MKVSPQKDEKIKRLDKVVIAEASFTSQFYTSLVSLFFGYK